MRSTWTDSRLDDFRGQVNTRFDDLNDRVSDLSSRVDHQSQRIDSLQHAIIVVGGGLFAACIAVLASILGLIATQL